MLSAEDDYANKSNSFSGLSEVSHENRKDSKRRTTFQYGGNNKHNRAFKEKERGIVREIYI